PGGGAVGLQGRSPREADPTEELPRRAIEAALATIRIESPMGAYPQPPILRIAIGRVLLRANSFCSQLDGPSFEHFPFAGNSTRLPLSISFLLVIGRAFLPAFLFCSQLNASSLDHFPFACNSWHPIAFFSVWILLQRAVGRFAIQSVHFHKLIELRTAQLQ